MCKKFLTVLVIGAIGVAALSRTKAGSYVRAQFVSLQEDVEDSIDPNVELRRIRYEISQIDKDMDTVKGDLAAANVEVREINQEVVDCRKEIEASEKLVRLHGDVLKSASDKDQIQWGARQIGYLEAKDLLSGEVKRHNDLKARLKISEARLVSQTQSRDLIKQYFDSMIEQKQELAGAVKDLENEVRLVQLEQVNSKYQNDGTRMADIKKSMADLRKRTLIRREKLSLTKAGAERSPAATQSVDEILAGLNANPVKPAHEEVKVISKP